MATDLSAVINTLGGIANAQNSQSTSFGDSVSNSWGLSSSKSFDNMDAWSLADAWSKGDSESSSWSNEGSESSSRTYGREASAQDIENAKLANQIQRDLWSEQADYNAKQAQIDRDFQREMSNTAYQRAVADLIKAGLNPILAVGNIGATTPVGAMASSGLAAAHKANAFAESESSSSSWGSSGSSSWSRERSKSQSASKTTGRAGSESYSSEGSSSKSHNESQSTTQTQLDKTLGMIKDQIALANKAYNQSSAKKAVEDAKTGRNRNGVVGWQSYKK